MTRYVILALLVFGVGCSGGGGGNDPNGDPNNSNNNANNPNMSCGVNPVQTSGDTAQVAPDGTVIFNPIAVGKSASFAIPAKESADTDETIVSARTSGAFQILSTFPMYVPKGETVHIEVSFAPTTSGETSSDLVLDTAKMGSMHVTLTGAGL